MIKSVKVLKNDKKKFTFLLHKIQTPGINMQNGRQVIYLTLALVFKIHFFAILHFYFWMIHEGQVKMRLIKFFKNATLE